MQECITLPFSLSLFQLLSPVLLFSTPWTAAHQAPLSTLSQHLLEFLPIQSAMPSNHLILRCPFLLSSSLLFSHYVVSDSLWPHGLQHARLPCPSVFLGACSKSRPLSQPSHSLMSPFPPALISPQHQGLFQWVSSSHQVAKVLELQLQSFQWIFRLGFL